VSSNVCNACRICGKSLTFIYVPIYVMYCNSLAHCSQRFQGLILHMTLVAIIYIKYTQGHHWLRYCTLPLYWKKKNFRRLHGDKTGHECYVEDIFVSVRICACVKWCYTWQDTTGRDGEVWRCLFNPTGHIRVPWIGTTNKKTGTWLIRFRQGINLFLIKSFLCLGKVHSSKFFRIAISHAFNKPYNQ